MSRTALAAGCLVGAAFLITSAGRLGQRPARRLRGLAPEGAAHMRRSGSALRPEDGRGTGDGAVGARAIAGSGGTRSGDAASGAGSGRWRPDAVRLVAGLAGFAAGLVIGGWPGLLVALPTAMLLDRLLRRIEPPAVRKRRLREAADLPLTADLLAAALRAGAPVDRSVLAVAEALEGPLADRLGRVGRTLLLGGGPEEAWAQLGPVPGAERMTTAALRSSTSGAALAGALTRLADDLRADRSTAAEASARRAGVLIVLPLGLCFLPAFILAGLVPVIVAVLGDVL